MNLDDICKFFGRYPVLAVVVLVPAGFVVAAVYGWVEFARKIWNHIRGENVNEP